MLLFSNIVVFLLVDNFDERPSDFSITFYFESDLILIVNYLTVFDFAGVTTEFLADFTGVTYNGFLGVLLTMMPKDEGGLVLAVIVFLLFIVTFSVNDVFELDETIDFLLEIGYFVGVLNDYLDDDPPEI